MILQEEQSVVKTLSSRNKDTLVALKDYGFLNDMYLAD